MSKRKKIIILVISALLLLAVTFGVLYFTGIFPRKYKLTYTASPAEGGSIEGDTKQLLRKNESGTQVSAKPAEGYLFEGWSDGVKDAERSDKIGSDTDIQAIFDTPEHTIEFTVTDDDFGYIRGETSQTMNDDGRTTTVQAIAKPGYRFEGWSDGKDKAVRSGESVTKNMKVQAIFISETPYAKMKITTENGELPQSKKTYLGAEVNISGASDNKYNLTDLKAQIRGRGNSTWDYFQTTKPSYRLTLDEKQELLGVGSGKDRDWVLLSNMSDISMLRCWSAFRMGEYFENVHYSTSSTYVQLYINGDYRGLYMLCELVEVAGSRIDIDDDSTENDKGYLIEIDARGESEGRFNQDFFRIKGWNPEFVIKSNADTKDQVTFIKNYITKMNDALLSGDRDKIDKYVDIPSLIDMFIINELTSNRDVGFASFYFYKDKGTKMYFAAPWDFDLALGNDDEFDDIESQMAINNQWFASLLNEKWFKTELYKRMLEVSDYIKQTVDDTAAMGKILKPYANENFKRWPVLGQPLFGSPDNVAGFQTYDEHVDYLTDWITKRWDWMLDFYKVKL